MAEIEICSGCNRLAEMEGNIQVIVTRLDYKDRVDEDRFRTSKVDEQFEKVYNHLPWIIHKNYLSIA